MKGWTEEQIRNKDLMAPCGLYCGTCEVYIATRDNMDHFDEYVASDSRSEEVEVQFKTGLC